jgi:hypothetical protein
MTDKDSGGPAKAERYREIANSVRALIPSMQNSDVRDQLDVLALEYDQLARCVEALSESLRTPPAPHSG